MEDKKIKNISTVVVKVGSSILVSKDNKLDKRRMQNISSQICRLKSKGINVVLVSSGAIASGMTLLKYTNRPKTIEELQAAAAIGQSQLMHDYEKLFRKNKILTAQVLLTPDDLHNRQRYLNARNTILTLLEKGVVPIVNENDTVATDEIRFGDNDKLSSLVATLIDAQLLIILSDVDGVYDKQGKVVEEVREIDSFVTGLAQDTKRQTSVGGMVTKIEAAKIATNAGIVMVVANGLTKDILLKIQDGYKYGTWFMPQTNKVTGKKRWIAFSCRGCGKILVDAGAKEALIKRGKSLLASGIVGVEGKFAPGDLVFISDKNGQEFARGLINYSNEEVAKIKGVKTATIKTVLGYKLYDEVIHRNNLVICQY
ncbi:MAG: glutamate 5-kinase [PVC group bacterium]|nr:glutamate 5-kinase [PVC group bacterium]